MSGAPKRLAACDVIKVEDEAFWEGQALTPDIIEILLGADLMPVARDIENPSQYNIIFASPRLLRSRPALAAIEAFIGSIQESEVSPFVTRARSHPVCGKASGVVQRSLRLE